MKDAAVTRNFEVTILSGCTLRSRNTTASRILEVCPIVDAERALHSLPHETSRLNLTFTLRCYAFRCVEIIGSNAPDV